VPADWPVGLIGETRKGIKPDRIQQRLIGESRLFHKNPRAIANYTLGMDFTKDLAFSGNGSKNFGW
jgi:hypothetical protein